MPATNFEQQQQYENGYPLNQEYPTYTQTWYGQQQQQQQGLMMQRQQQFGGLVEDVVISGVSGRFPESQSENVEELAQNLYNGIFREKRSKWQNEMGLFGLEKKYETVREIIKETKKKTLQYGQQQFGGEYEMIKPLLEVTYEAIFDSGVNPIELKGTRTGVFIGGPHNSDKWTQPMKPFNMWGQELASVFDFRGPTQYFNTTCSSSLIALNEAITAIKSGQCDYAIVAGIGGQFNGEYTQPIEIIGQQQQQQQGFGTVGVVFLQKKTATKRFYAKILHSKLTMDLVKEQQQSTYQIGEIQTRVLRDIYGQQTEIDPSLITYVETHFPGTKLVDGQLFNSIAEVFTSPRLGRTMPLFVGSTQSRHGHQEPAQTIFGLIKMMIAIQRGIIPANLHYQEPTHEGIMFVNTNTRFQGGLIALNSFCFGGVNGHIVMQPNNETTMKIMGEQSFWNQDLTEVQNMPHLFHFSSKTQQGVEEVFKYIKKNPTDLATKFLLQSCNWQTSPMTHPYRGFTVLNGQTEIQEIKQVNFGQEGEKQPIWYVFGGMGSQWQGMGQEMMKVETFRHSIKRSAEYLRPYGLNLIDLIYSKQQTVYQRPLNAFVGIAAIQIALVDCLRQAGIECDGMIGHSVGELGCAYADETLNSEETLLVAYYRGKCIEEAQLPTGSMAVVGLTWEECQQRCPSGVVPACHNGTKQVTISGPKRAVFEFVQQLNREGVYAKEIETSEIAYHSYYMTSIAPQLRIVLEKVIKSPKLRSSRWLSTSIPEQRWESELARFSSPDYHVNNLCNPVLFQETLKYIPTNAIVIEVGPHALLQEILSQSLPRQTTIVPLMRKDVRGQLEHFWTQFGRIYNAGVNVDSVKMFVPFGREYTLFPVPVNAGFISHLAKYHVPEGLFYQQQPRQWTKSTTTTTTTLPYGQQTVQQQVTKTSVTHQYPIDLTTDLDESYLRGNQIEGRIVYPATGYLYLVWKSFAKMNGYEQVEQFPVGFENVEIQRATFINESMNKIVFNVTIMPTGLFEVSENGTIIVSGRVYTPEKPFEMRQQQEWTGRQQGELLEQEQVYKQLRERGYEFSGEFQPIIRTDVQGKQGELAWTGKWVPFLEAFLQMNLFGGKPAELMMPRRIRSIRINPTVHLQTQRFYIGGQQGFEQTLEQQPIELLEQWVGKFEGLQQEQHKQVYQWMRQHHQQMPEQVRRLMGEWETYMGEEHQQQPQGVFYQQQGEWTSLPAQQQQKPWGKHFERLQQLIRHQQQQQKWIERIMRQVQVNPSFTGKQQEQIEELKQVIYEQHQFHLEQQIYEQEFEQMRIQFKQQLGMQLVIVQELISLFPVQQWGPKFGQFQKLMVQLEQMIQEQSLQWYQRVAKSQKRRQLEKSYLEQLQQHLFSVQQVLGQPISVLPVELREIAKELESYIDEQIQFQVERESTVEQMRKQQQNVQEQLKEQLFYLQQFAQQQSFDECPKKFLTGLELFIQEQQQQESLNELRKQREQQMYSNNQQKLEKFIELLDLFEQPKLVSGQQQYHQQWFEELRQMWQQRKLMHQQFGWELQTPSFGGRKHQPKQQQKLRQLGQQSTVFYPVAFNPITKTYVCGGIELNELDFVPVPRQQQQQQRKIEFVPFIQKGQMNGGKFVVIEPKQRRQSLNTEWEQQLNGEQQTTPGQFREFLEFYLNECKRFTGHIMKKIEQQTNGQQLTTIIVPTPLPKSLEQLFEKQQSGRQMTATELVEGGKLLQLLTQAANLDNTDGQYFAKVQKLFNDKLAYWKALEEDRVLNYLNKRSYYLKSVLDNLLENGHQQQQPRHFEVEEQPQPHFNLIKRVKIALGDNVTLKVRDIILATEKLTNEVLERNKRINERINASRALVDLIDNIKSFSLQHHQQQQEQQQSRQFRQVLSQTLPKVWFSPLQTYIITSGLTGFGLELTQWMVERGARYIVLTGKYGTRTQQQQRKLRYLQEEFGAQIRVLPYNVKEEGECVALIQEATQMGIEKKIGGIFHFDIVAQDAELQRMETFRCVVNLDKYTRMSEQPIMDDSGYFVVFTTLKSEQEIFTPKSIVQRICETRRQYGKHALKVQWEELFGGEQQSPFFFDETIMQNPIYLAALRKFEQLLLKSIDTVEGRQQQWGQQSWGKQFGQQLEQQPWGKQFGQQLEQQPWGKQLGQQLEQQPWGKQFGQQLEQQPWGKQVSQQLEQQPWGKQVSQQFEQQSLVGFTLRMLGVRGVDAWKNEQTPLIELGLDMLMAGELKQFIELKFNQTFTVKEVQQLTIEQLRQIEQGQRKQQQLFGLQKRMNYLMPTKPIEKLNQVEFIMQSQQVPVVVIHPIEGHVNMLKSWAKHMKYPVYGVQYTREAMQYETVEQLADFYWQQIENELFSQQQVGRVHLCGFSFGGSVAIEMSLRKPAFVSSLTLLDSGKQYQQEENLLKVQQQTPVELEIEALYTFAQQYLQQLQKREFYSELNKLVREQRVKYVVRELMTKSQFQFEPIDLEQAARGYVTKYVMLNKYQPKQNLRLSEVLLIKSAQQKQVQDFFGLNKIFNGKVQVHVVDGDCRSFLEGNNGFQVASIVNENLLRFF